MKKMINRVVSAVILALIIGATPTAIPDAHADTGCETIPWGFLASQRRTICDGPMHADGSWSRGRVISVPAHEVPFTCYYGTYMSSCSGGYFVDETIISKDAYPVTPDTVLPDEPGYLGCSICIGGGLD